MKPDTIHNGEEALDLILRPGTNLVPFRLALGSICRDEKQLVVLDDL